MSNRGAARHVGELPAEPSDGIRRDPGAGSLHAEATHVPATPGANPEFHSGDASGGVACILDAPEKSQPKQDVIWSEPVTLWLRRADQLFLGILLLSLLSLLICFRWRLSQRNTAEIEIVNQQPREYFYAIEINRASWVEWAQLDGIGEKLARRIVDDRAERGPFPSVNDVTRVRGVGEKLIEKLRPFLKCDAEIKELPSDGPQTYHQSPATRRGQ